MKMVKKMLEGATTPYDSIVLLGNSVPMFGMVEILGMVGRNRLLKLIVVKCGCTHQ